MVHRVVASAFDPLRIEGSRLRGGRYNPPGEFGALYCSLDATTAVAEVVQGQRARGVDPSTYPEGSWWVYDLDVVLESVLDLTDSKILAELGIEEAALTGGDIARTRRLGREARAAGFLGILAPSAALSGGRNLVIFLDAVSHPLGILRSRPIALQ